ncbi:MAG: DUF1844 domain-containing protein [Pirellulaceae bacterium]|nr:DUF1844 domain-containing protein [Pirellulaceae bacterium]
MTDPKKPDDIDENSDNEEKLVVDTDWKEQVAKEKEAAARAAQESSSDEKNTDDSESTDDDFVPMDSSSAASDSSVSANDDPDSSSEGAPPPASLEFLVGMLFTQAMAALGQMPNPVSGKPEINKPFAKHYIDTLEMLGEKTKGNTTDDESKMLGEALHALRMTYVSVKG